MPVLLIGPEQREQIAELNHGRPIGSPCGSAVSQTHSSVAPLIHRLTHRFWGCFIRRSIAAVLQEKLDLAHVLAHPAQLVEHLPSGAEHKIGYGRLFAFKGRNGKSDRQHKLILPYVEWRRQFSPSS